ncbi:MAG TPA: UbiX family flavin prenyltransferase [Candidatus Bathyarchaeia archaeon]|nr:UbiX family flavin prenyltransferase [Candidatus Bathyarchaeia archaeon]
MTITVAITGASGVQYGVRLLEVLSQLGVGTQLVMTKSGQELLGIETDYSLNYVMSLANRTYDETDLTAPIASGSHISDGMVIIPCSVKTLGSIAHGVSSNLVIRAADVCLKERRRLILVVRETPLNAIHLDNMLTLSRCGVIIMPASPGFYTRPATIEELIDVLIARVLDLLQLKHSVSRRWGD